VRRIPEQDLFTVEADPFCSQATGDAASNRRRQHRNDNQIHTSCELERASGHPAFDHGETAENPIPLPNASSTKVSAAAAIPPATIAAHEVAD
jgi:hypothetical protein